MDSSVAKEISKRLRGQVYKGNLCDVDYCWVGASPGCRYYGNDYETGQPFEEERCVFHGTPFNSTPYEDSCLYNSLNSVMQKWILFNSDRASEERIPLSIVNGKIDKVQLEKIDIKDKVIFSKCDFTEAFFLCESSVDRIEFSNCKINFLEITDNNVNCIDLVGCDLDYLVVKNSNINEINIENCSIGCVIIENNNIKNCFYFLNTTVKESFFSSDHSTVLGGDFSKAHIEKTTKVTFSGTYMKNSRYKSSEDNPWKKLKQNYTGAKMFLAILFLLIFISPFLIKAIAYKFVNFMQSNYIAYDQTLVFSEKILCGGSSCSEVYLYKYILGSVDSYALFIFSSVLVVYNLLRGYVTYLVNIKSKDEELSGYYPDLKKYKFFEVNEADFNFFKDVFLNIKNWFSGYSHLIFLDKILSYLMWISIFSLVYRLYSFFSITLWVPIG